ncbi:MAG: transcriptional regulator [Nitrosopumilaceae archaeon]|nr:transcriptional regulator [Nitrosopumilaceae archaeon]
MGGVDRFLATEFSKEIKKQITEKDLKKIERTLFLQEGMSIKLSIEHFSKLHNTIKNIIRRDPSNIEKQSLQKLCIIKQNKNNNFVITFVSKKLSQTILENFGDNETRKILSTIMGESHTTPEILDVSKLPKTSAYRKIENLIINGLIIEDKKILSQSKKISKYVCIFEKLSIDFSNNSLEIKGIITKKQAEKSSVFKKLIIT